MPTGGGTLVPQPQPACNKHLCSTHSAQHLDGDMAVMRLSQCHPPSSLSCHSEITQAQFVALVLEPTQLWSFLGQSLNKGQIPLASYLP